MTCDLKLTAVNSSSGTAALNSSSRVRSVAAPAMASRAARHSAVSDSPNSHGVTSSNCVASSTMKKRGLNAAIWPTRLLPWNANEAH